MRARRKRIWILAPALMAGLGASAAFADTGLGVKVEPEKALYALGVRLGRAVMKFGLDEEELGIVVRGLEDVVLGRPIHLNESTYRHQVDGFLATRRQIVLDAEREASAAFVAAARDDEKAEITESGCVVTHLHPGSGETPGPDDQVLVHYHGRLRDGTVFESSVDRGAPESFSMRSVAICWREGLQRMKVGGKARFVCPAETAFGDRGKEPWVLGEAAVSYEVELLRISD